MADVFEDIFDPLIELIDNGKVEFFYSYARDCKCCAIDDTVLEFHEEEEGSLKVRYQNLSLLWVRETPGWDNISNILSDLSEEDNDNRGLTINRHLYVSLSSKLLNNER